MIERVRRTFPPSVVIAIVTAAVAVLVPRYPPMTDLPFHEAVVVLLRTMGDTTRFTPGLYETHWGFPNQLFYALAWGLSYPLSIDAALKVAVFIVVSLIPWGVSVTARHWGITSWVAIVAIPISLGWLFLWGLVPNLFGLGLVFALLPTIDRFVEGPTLRGAAGACGAMLLVYFAHEMMLFVFLMAYGVFAVSSIRRWRAEGANAFALRVVPPAFISVVVAIAFRVQHQRVTASRVLASVRTSFYPLLSKVRLIPVDLFGKHTNLQVALLFGAFLLTVAYLVVVSRYAPVASRQRRRLAGASAVVFVAYFTAPHLWHGATWLHHRFLAPAVLLGVVACIRPIGHGALAGSRVVRAIVMACVPLATLSALFPLMKGAGTTYLADRASASRLMQRVPLGASVARVQYYPRDPTGKDDSLGDRARMSVAAVILRNGGRTNMENDASPILPVQIAAPYRWDDVSLRLTAVAPAIFVPYFDFTRFAYALLRCPHDHSIAAKVLEPYAERVADDGPWMLFRSKLDVVPMTSPDLVLPEQQPRTLLQLMQALAQEQETASSESSAKPTDDSATAAGASAGSAAVTGASDSGAADGGQSGP